MFAGFNIRIAKNIMLCFPIIIDMVKEKLMRDV